MQRFSLRLQVYVGVRSHLGKLQGTRLTYPLVHSDAVAPNTVIGVLKHILGFEGQPLVSDPRARENLHRRNSGNTDMAERQSDYSIGNQTLAGLRFTVRDSSIR